MRPDLVTVNIYIYTLMNQNNIVGDIWQEWQLLSVNNLSETAGKL